MLPSLSHQALPSVPHDWVCRDIQPGFLSDPSSSYISMTDLLTAHHQPYLDSTKPPHEADESRDGDSEWADLLGCAESLEYVSPDIEQCLAENRAHEADQELDLIGNEFLHSPTILPTISAPEPSTATPEKFLPDSPARPARALSSLSQRNGPQRSGLRDISSTLNNKLETPARANSSGARSLRPLNAVKKEQILFYNTPPDAILRGMPAEDAKENVSHSSSRSKRASYGKANLRKTGLSRHGRSSLDTPDRPSQAKALDRKDFVNAMAVERDARTTTAVGAIKVAASASLMEEVSDALSRTAKTQPNQEVCARATVVRGIYNAHLVAKFAKLMVAYDLAGGKRCAVDGCVKSSQEGGLCRGHGGGKQCKSPHCMSFRNESGFCDAHASAAARHPPNLTTGTLYHKCGTNAVQLSASLIGANFWFPPKRCPALREARKQEQKKDAAMTQDSQVECAAGVVLQEARDGGDLQHTTLASTLQLKKEIGNARLVSGDAMLWVGEAKLTQKDVDVGGKSAKEFRLEKGARSFVFTLETTAASKQFVDELREQIDGKLGLEVKRKKRKIRKQMSQAMGFVPVNMLKSPMKTKPPATPTKLPTSASKSPRLAKPLEVSVATVPDAYQSYPSPSPSKSPFRSPFRKKPAPRQSNLPLSPSLTDPRIASSPRVREWLSPVGSLKMKVELTPPEIRRHSLGAPTSDGSTTDGRTGSPSTRITNKRVRSLQGLLDDVPKDTQPMFTPPKPKLELTPPKQNIVSHYFAKKVLKSESPSAAEAQGEKHKLSPTKPTLLNQSKHEESQGESTSRESTQEAEPSDQPSAPTLPKRSIRGLLNLGNYCYMNSIVQAVTKLPDFVAGVQNEEWLHKLIQKKLGHDANSANSKTMEEVKAIVDAWKDRDESKTLVLHSTLEEVIKKIMTGCDSPINPEPIKQVMGRKNAIFATHFQQDAHEFLLNLVNEYEKELLSAVKSAVEKVKEEAAVEPPAAPKRSSLLNFFRSEAKQEGESKAAKSNATAAAEEDDLVGELLPAKCFRAELYRTLTCTACEYSRKQVERFYDFSLDLPFNPVRRTDDAAAAAAAAREKPSKKQCFCEVDAAVRNTITERIYHCAKAACSYQEKVPTEIVPQPSNSEQQQEENVESAAAIGDQAGFPIASAPPSHPTIILDSLMRKQFEPETLELSCEKCRTGKEAVAAYAVKSLPPVIVLHLKRFEVDFKTGKLYKRCDLVEAPASLKPRHTIVGEAESEDDQSYELVSVVHHLGRSIDEGHYVADVREHDRSWMRRNDTHESVISEDYALRASRSQESCYMFFYVRSDTLVEHTDKENLPMALAATAVEDAENRPLHQLKTPVKKKSGDGAFL